MDCERLHWVRVLVFSYHYFFLSSLLSVFQFAYEQAKDSCRALGQRRTRVECKALTCGDRVQPVMRLSRDECLCWVREKGCGVTGGRGKVGGLVGDHCR